MSLINLKQLRGDIQGGLGSGLVNLFQCVPYGLIAMAPLGEEYSNLGIVACIMGSVLAGFFASLFGGSPAQITAPSATVCILFGYILIYASGLNLTNPNLPDPVSYALAMTFLAIVMCGVFQVLFGLLHADYLFKFISYPVIAGIATGAGILIIYNSFFNLVGLPDNESFFTHVHPIQYGTLFIGLTTALLLHYRNYLIKGSLGFPLMIAIGILLYYILHAIGLDKDQLGGTLEKFSFQTNEIFNTSIQIFTDPKLWSHIKTLTPLSLNLAILCSLQSLLSVLALKNVSEKNANSQKELIGQGIGNIVSGCFGCLPSSGTFSRSLLNYYEGGRTRLSGIICSLFTLILALIFSPYFQYLPNAVIIGIVISLGLHAIDKWTIYLFYKIFTRKVKLSTEVLSNAGIIVAVIALILSGNFIPAIGAGVVISIILFLSKMRGTLIKRIYEAQSVPSKKIDNETVMDFLTKHRHEIKIIELDGIIYFGSAEKLSLAIEQLSDSGVLHFILDMKKVTEIDLTGARVLETTFQTLKKQGKSLSFSYLEKNSPVWTFFENIEFFEKIDPKLIFSDTDHALQYFEGLLLSKFDYKTDNTELKIEEIPVFKEFTERELTLLTQTLKREIYETGESVFKEGDTADAIFFIAKGTADVLISVGELRLYRTKRVQTLSSGTFFGEMALLQRGPRTATVVASSELICYRLSIQQFEDYVKGNSPLSVSLLSNISRILSKRILFINQMIAEMEG